MRMGLGAVFLALSVSVSGALELPKWQDGDREALEEGEWCPGADLLVMGPLRPPPFPAEQAAIELPSEAEMVGEDFGEGVPERFLDRYFGQRPESFIHDPQGLFSAEELETREGFLRYHSENSQIDFYVYLFDLHQQIPTEVREEELPERFFNEGKPSLVLFYYLGDAQRSKILLSPMLTETVSDAEQRRALKSAVLAGLEKSDPLDQLEAFCVQTSIRIYWMEKAAGLEPRETFAVVSPGMMPLVELPLPPTQMEKAQATLGFWWQQWGLPALVIGGSALAGLFALTLSRFRARFKFPEFEVAPRLGGSHAAGVGAVIGFGSTTQSPSEQKNEIPGYLGGI